MTEQTHNQPDGSQAIVSNGKLKTYLGENIGQSNVDQMGYFGNIWVRSHFFKKAGDNNGGGHTHNFDHVTLLAVGSVLCEVEGHEPKRFDAPTFITIDKDHSHKFTALTDGVVYYCVFAVRNIDGDVEDIVTPLNSPLDVAIPHFANIDKIKSDQI
jgi:hypothetical protein